MITMEKALNELFGIDEKEAYDLLNDIEKIFFEADTIKQACEEAVKIYCKTEEDKKAFMVGFTAQLFAILTGINIDPSETITALLNNALMFGAKRDGYLDAVEKEG